MRGDRARAIASFAAFACAIFLAGCGSQAPPTAFAHRTKLADCGTAPLRTTSDAEVQTRDRALDCFARARMSGTAAEVHLRSFSTEGARSDRWLRTLPDGTIEDFGHTEGDEFGADSWTYARCASLTTDRAGLPMPVDCARTYP